MTTRRQMKRFQTQSFYFVPMISSIILRQTKPLRPLSLLSRNFQFKRLPCNQILYNSHGSPIRIHKCFSSTGTPVSASAHIGDTAAVVSRPPLAVRAAIVGASVGLTTPLFALGGFVRLWYSYLPKSDFGRYVKILSSIILGTGGVGLCYNYVIPFLQYNSDFMLPFAVSNAVMSTFWYVCGELVFGLEVMMSGVTEAALLANKFSPAMAGLFSRAFGIAPVGGAIIGALTAITAPFLWPLFQYLCWDKDLFALLLKDDKYWMIDLYNWVALPVGVPIGMLAGATLHLLLKSFILGNPSTPWVNRSLPLLVTVTGASVLYYTLFKSFSTDFMWEKRIHYETGLPVSYNARTNSLLLDNGEAADFAAMKREVIKRIKQVRYLFRYNTEQPYSARPLHSKGDVTVSVLDERAILFHVVDLLVRVKYLKLEKEKQRHAPRSSSPTRPRVDYDAAITATVKDFEAQMRRNNSKFSFEKLLEWVERGIVAKHIEDRFEKGDVYRGSDHMLAESIRRIQNMSDCAQNDDIRDSLAFLAHNFDMVSEEFKNKLGYEITEGSALEKKMVEDYRTFGTIEAVTHTMKVVLLAGIVGSACAAAAILFGGGN